MHKIIEFVLVTDPQSLKEKLEQMVNRGWEIKGFVSFHQDNTYTESFAVMETITEQESVKMEEFETKKSEPEQSPYPKAPKKKEISISLGGN